MHVTMATGSIERIIVPPKQKVVIGYFGPGIHCNFVQMLHSFAWWKPISWSVCTCGLQMICWIFLIIMTVVIRLYTHNRNSHSYVRTLAQKAVPRASAAALQTNSHKKVCVWGRYFERSNSVLPKTDSLPLTVELYPTITAANEVVYNVFVYNGWRGD